MAGTVSDPRLQPARPWEQNTGAGAAPLADTKSASGRKIVLLFLGSICALTLLVIVLIYALTNAGPTGSTRSETSATAPSDYAKSNPAPLPPKSADTILDENMVASGWTLAESGNLFWRWADDSNVTCGTYPCSGVEVRTGARGCPGGVYVEAAIMNGETSIGRDNEITAGLRDNASAAIILKNYLGYGDSLRMSDVHCMG